MSGAHDRRAERPARAAAGAPRAVPAHRHREAAGLRARAQARVPRSSGRSPHRARRGGAGLPLVGVNFGYRQKPGISDAGEPARTDQGMTMSFAHEVASAAHGSAGPGRHARAPVSRCDGAGVRAARTAPPAKPVHRFQAFYVPNGMAMEYWTPKGEGAASSCRRCCSRSSRSATRCSCCRASTRTGCHSRWRVRLIPDRHAARRQDRDRDLRRHVDGSAACAALRAATRRSRRWRWRWTRRPTPARARAI